MKYFPALILILFFAAASLWFWHFSRRLRRDHLGKLISRNLLRQQETIPGKSFYSAETVRAITNCLLGQKRIKSENLVKQIQTGQIQALADNFPKRSQAIINIGLLAMFFPRKATADLEKSVKKQADFRNLLMLCALYLNQGEMIKARRCLDNISEKKLRGSKKARWAYYQSFFELQDGDLLSASEYCSAAVRIFNKLNDFYSEAEAHLLLGTIYRVSGVFDTAQFMLETAAKIFKDLQASKMEAESYGNLGMLMIGQNRKEEADDYFQKALDIYQNIKQLQGEAEIINQQALSELIENNYELSKKLANEAFQIHQNLGNETGVAFSLEILSHIALAQNDWQSAGKNAVKAQKFYAKTHNTSALMEAMFLEARADFEQDELKLSEKLLRKLINASQKQASCFHIANAYNLLGLIYVKQNDFKRAKGLFQQSLNNELRNSRCQGAAIDYANIALIESRRGHSEQAQKTLQTALEYAKAYGENELSDLLEKRLSKIQAQK